jgi:hypothetical protein
MGETKNRILGIIQTFYQTAKKSQMLYGMDGKLKAKDEKI